METHFSEPTKKFQEESLPKKSLSFFSLLLLFLVQFYRAFLGSYFGGSCRFQPTCSQYALDVLHSERPLRAISLIFRRIIKCRPFGQMGYDPAPQTHERKI